MKNRLFNISGETTASSPDVINAPQSALTFAGAPALVTVVVKVLGAVQPT